ncbi:uncharacterized protein TNCV_5039801 [Trichonephila clavipes]|nr:uncharacterized protein TNCV_5039801 [Trichonephila clavipes]
MRMITISAQTHITRACGATSKRYLRLGDFDDFKFLWCFQKRSAMSRRKHRSAFDQVSELDRGRIVAYREILDYLSEKSVAVLDETKQL